jgi:hypothetical protein
MTLILLQVVLGLGILVQRSYQIQTGQGNHLPTMVSTSNGKILKSVYISKTILSQAIDQSLFKYVSFKRLLEVETGYTTNEPVQMAVTEAIESSFNFSFRRN